MTQPLEHAVHGDSQRALPVRLEAPLGVPQAVAERVEGTVAFQRGE